MAGDGGAVGRDPEALVGGGLYAGLLGEGWGSLDGVVREMHCAPGRSVRAEGDFRITRGRGWLVALVAWVMGLPPASEATRTVLTITTEGEVERWHRSFGGCEVTTLQARGPRGLLEERFGSTALMFRLVVEGGGLRYAQEGVGLRLGWWVLSLPGWMGPRVSATERASSVVGCTDVDVEIEAPLLGRLARYEGTIRASSVGEAGIEGGA